MDHNYWTPLTDQVEESEDIQHEEINNTNDDRNVGAFDTGATSSCGKTSDTFILLKE